jgi:ferric-dicitrate binding protein FerR (iron transport regulator)
MNDQYQTYNDFLADSYFRQWVRQPDEASTLYWETFLTEHPEQRANVTQATDALRALAVATEQLIEPVKSAEKDAAWAAIQARISQPTQSANPFLGRSRSLWGWLSVAASVCLVAGIGWWGFHTTATSPEIKQQPVAVLSQFVDEHNASAKPHLLNLPDGSSVILQPNSRLTYERRFDKAQRTVYLRGEAFFEVAKNRQRPFLVHANELWTKVLGTSFNIRAYAHDKNVTVTVRSGRVAVFTQKEARKRNISSPSLEGTILKPNQQIVFARQEDRLISPKRITPSVLARKVPAFSPVGFVFAATPVSTVFAELEKVYGVQIVYDKTALGNCRLTADLSDETLTNKLAIICKTIEATYSLDQTTIHVSGPGCH